MARRLVFITRGIGKKATTGGAPTPPCKDGHPFLGASARLRLRRRWLTRTLNPGFDAVIQCLEKEIKDLDETWTGLHSNPALASARISFTES